MPQKPEKTFFKSGVLSNIHIRGDFYLLTISWKGSFSAKPGQFVMIRPDYSVQEISYDPLLPRPFSICEYSVKNSKPAISICYRVIGRGTKIISGLQKCDSVFCLGPLGNGFTQPEQNTDVIAVAGGCGIAPLYFYCREYRGHVKLIYGARSKDHLLLLEEIKSLSAEHIFVTEDGSLGKKGMATDILNNVLQKKRKMLLIACGPEPMLKKVKNIAIEKNIRCEISVESYMACGIGACLGCSVKAAEGGYKRVCTDGPVFDVKDIEF